MRLRIFCPAVVLLLAALSPNSSAAATAPSNPRSSWVYLLPTGMNFSAEQIFNQSSPVTFEAKSFNPLGFKAGTLFPGGWSAEAIAQLFKFSLNTTYLGTTTETSHSGKNLSLDAYKVLGTVNSPFRFTTKARLGVSLRSFFYTQPSLNPTFEEGTLTGVNIGLSSSTDIARRVRLTLGLRIMPTLKVSANASDLKGKLDFAGELGGIYLISSAWVVGAQVGYATAGAKGNFVANGINTDSDLSFKTTSFSGQIGYQF